MPLTTRPAPYIVPSYSLTGDLLAYLACGLQYRYQNRGALPPSKPVQLWFGQFIHGVLEEAYRLWAEAGTAFPWGAAEIDPIVDRIHRRLEARGVTFQRFLLLGIAIERAYVAINELGPMLFPRITKAEVTLQGIRPLPVGAQTSRQSHYYEVAGVVDVLTSVQLPPVRVQNPIENAILQAVAADRYEVIVDYKGMRRPSLHDPDGDAWQHHAWQVQTYAWLRAQQAGAAPVRSGMLLYLNELVPSAEDMQALYVEVLGGGERTSDRLPTGTDLDALRAWPSTRRPWGARVDAWQREEVREWWFSGRDAGLPFPRMPAPLAELSAEYRRDRAIRVVTVSDASVADSLAEFDHLVTEIEAAVAHEVAGQPIPDAWTPRPREATCTVCDFRKFCPAPGNRYRSAPQAP